MQCDIMDAKMGFVGTPAKISPDFLRNLAEAEIIPIIAPIGFGPKGETLNVNGDTAAGAIAAALKADRLLLLTDVAGVMDANGTVLTDLTADQIRDLTKDGTISGGMIPKVECCINALEGGVGKTHIIDGRVRHAVLLEIFTQAGVGTEVVLK